MALGENIRQDPPIDIAAAEHHRDPLALVGVAFLHRRGQRGGAGAVHQGWSARQRGQRMQAQAEQDRLGEAQQSGQGGIEQYQHAGSQQSDSGMGGSKGLQGRPDLPASDFGSKPNKKNPGS